MIILVTEDSGSPLLQKSPCVLNTIMTQPPAKNYARDHDEALPNKKATIFNIISQLDKIKTLL